MTEQDELSWLRKAFQLSREEKFTEALKTLQQHPEHPGSLHLQGLIYLELGQNTLAQQSLEKALRRGATADVHLNLGRNYLEDQQYTEARRHFESAQQMSLLNDDADLHRYALCLHATGDTVNALNLYQQLLQKHPDHPELWMHVGNALIHLGRSDAALEMFKQGLQQSPKNPLLRFNLARAYMMHSLYTKARSHLEKCLEIDGNFASAWQLMAMLEQEDGQFEAALSCAKRAHYLDPDDPDILNTLGACHKDNLNYQAAQENFSKVLELQSEHIEAHLNLAEIYRLQNKTEDSAFELQKLILNFPAAAYLQALNLPIVYKNNAQTRHWQNKVFDHLELIERGKYPLQKPLFEIAQSPFYLPYSGMPDDSIKDWLIKYNRLLKHFAPALHSPFEAQGSRQKKLKLGLLSSHFCQHTVIGLFGHLLETLSRDSFELICLSIPVKRDKVNQKLRLMADQFIEVPQDLEQARDLIRQQNLDLLLFLDHGLHPLSWFLGHFRMAPIQMLTWGHGITSGQNEIDYFLSNEALESPDSDSFYSEKLVRLPELLGIFNARDEIEDRPELCREKLNLDPKATLYLCPQTPYKFHPDFDELLFQIFDADPQGQLLLIEPEHPSIKAALLQRWQDKLKPQHCVWLPRLSQGDYLSLLAAGDVMLDTTPFGGGMTMMQALSVGTPLVSCPGPGLKSRLAFASAQHCHCEQGIVKSKSDYAEQAINLAKSWNETERKALKQAYRDNMNLNKSGQILGDCLQELWESR